MEAALKEVTQLQTLVARAEQRQAAAMAALLSVADQTPGELDVATMDAISNLLGERMAELACARMALLEATRRARLEWRASQSVREDA